MVTERLVCYNRFNKKGGFDMRFNEEMNIHEVLDYINDKFNYAGIDNNGRKTKDRDDLIKKNAFHNWIRRYNEKNTRKNLSIRNFNKRAQQQNEPKKELLKIIEPIKTSKQNKDTFYKREDVDILIKLHQKSLNKAYLEKTKEAWVGWDQDIKKRVATSILDSRVAQEFHIDYVEKQHANEFKERVLMDVIDKYIDKKRLSKDCDLYLSNDKNNINLKDYIKVELLY